MQITDGLIDSYGGDVNREELKLIRTPEAFRLKIIDEYFDEQKKNTSIISHCPPGCNILINMTEKFDIKITYPEDLFLVEQLINISYESTKDVEYDLSKMSDVLLLGGSGGLGQVLVKFFELNNIRCYAPPHEELDLRYLSVEQLTRVVPFEPKVIINVAAEYSSDDFDYLETFDSMMDVNVKANLVIIRYAESLKKRVNILLFSSSSSTRGRKNLTNYSASKAALNSIVESQSEYLASHGIILNALVPEKINTPLIQKLHKQQISSRELLEPTELIPLIIKYSTTDYYGKLVHIRKGL